jgi:hypothetical protein
MPFRGGDGNLLVATLRTTCKNVLVARAGEGQKGRCSVAVQDISTMDAFGVAILPPLRQREPRTRVLHVPAGIGTRDRETAVGRVLRSELVYGEPKFRAAVDFMQCMDAHAAIPGFALALLRHPRLLSAAISIAGLPTVTVELSRQSAAVWSAPNFPPATRGLAGGRAQAVLDLQSDDDVYLAGHRKQALRTNLNHAKRAGVTVTRLTTYQDWLAAARGIYQKRPGGQEVLRQIGPPDDDEKMVYLVALNRTGTPVAIAGAVILDRLGVLFNLITRPGEPQAAVTRYLVHTDLRSWLKLEGVQFLTAGSALRLGAGLQYFQHLLGYEVRNLRITSERS